MTATEVGETAVLATAVTIEGISIARLAEGKEAIPTVRCGICKQVQWGPVLCDACLDAFCEACMDRFVRQSNGICPCGQPFVRRQINKRLQDSLALLKFTCTNAKCPDLIPYSELLLHAKSCPYEPIPCPNAPCKASLLRNELEKHLSVDCPAQREVCEFCKAPIQRCDKATHNTLCPLKPISCEYSLACCSL